MFARVRVDVGTRKGCIEVPERAIVELQGKTFVWVVNKDNTTNQRPVKIGETNGSNIIVTEGLNAGERIILDGVLKAREGAPITPVTAAQLAAAKAAPAAPTAPAKSDKK